MKIFRNLYLVTGMVSIFFSSLAFAETASKEILFRTYPNHRFKCEYSLNRNKNHYIGSFVVKSKGKIVWGQDWVMEKRDFENLVQYEFSRQQNMSFWVKNIFTANYGVKSFVKTLHETEIDNDFLEEASQYYKIPAEKLKEEILSAKESLIITYRAAWAEDQMSLVFVNSIGKFICFKRGIE